jgi:signal transduction histidine kinase
VRVLSRPVVIPGKGSQVGVVTALRDVTLERELDKMKEEFLHSITHDLRNPVGSVIGFTEFLLKGVVGVLNEQQKGMVSSISKASTRLLSMINNILDAAKMETGKIEVKIKPIALAGVAGHAIDVLGALAQRRGIKMELAAQEEFSILADGDLMERVFANLLGNAIKFAAEDGKIIISIVDNGDNCLKACVADDGEGIPEQYLHKIFEKFEQVPGQRRGGTGLGLTICKYIVEAHLGRIWVESEVGKGARFYFTVPKDLGYNGDGEVVRMMGAAL